MVRYGFSLWEVRNLYVDEFYSYFEALAEHLESEGIVKEGFADRVKGKTDVDVMRKQLKKFNLKK